jgi:ATP-dependent DNA helicase DinG
VTSVPSTPGAPPSGAPPPMGSAAGATISPPAASLHAALDAFFAEGGPLARRLPGYKPRAAQIDMAHLVADALRTEKGRLAVEAGTGTGKSLAYLAAALLADKRVAVTTGTKALQDQLYTKDVPLALACVADLKGEAEEIDPAVLMKGRQNYLCKLRYERFQMQPTFAFASEAQAFVQITRWAQHTTTGDRAELTSLPEPYVTWSDLDAGSETCIGMKCQHYEQCFVVKMRRRADGARLIVANHHLLCADLRVRLESRGNSDMGFAKVLPDVDAYLLDEAHVLPEVASDYFGVQVGSVGLARLFTDVRKHADGLGGDDRAAVLDAMLAAEERLERLLVQVHGGGGGRDRVRLSLPPVVTSLREAAVEALGALEKALEAVADETLAGLADGATRTAERLNLVGRVGSARGEVDFVLGRAADDPSYVVVSEPTRRGALVTAAPVDVAAALEGTLFDLSQPVVMTSATLAVANDVRPWLEKVGVPAESAVTRVLPSPFDYARRAALYCPTNMPEPSHPSYAERFFDEARFLLEMTRGGALFLFTSIAAMEEGYEALLPTARKLDVPAFRQGEMQKNKLLDELRAHDGETGALLCATRSFWEGVDVRGRALRLVVVDRLPFEVPTDPLRQARAELRRSRGGDPFLDQALPEAALALKQGAGRLIRDVEDAGLVAVLDGRLRTKRYGRVFLETLPPLTRIGARRPLLEFWERFVRPSLGLAAGPAPALGADGENS